MSFTKLSAAFLIAGLSLTGCGSLSQNERVAETQPYPNDIADQTAMVPADYNYWAKENLDLRAVGTLLEEADDAEEFERMLNSREGVNNLDLNGDGDADYISVREFGDEYEDRRGFSLFSMFGPEMIQEIATIFFDRSGSNLPGARVLLAGNEQIYGDNNYYETNWAERALPIVSWLFNRNRNDAYQSPYYNENYPDYYEPYQIIETPVYRSRIEQIYSDPVFVQTSAQTIERIQLRSPYRGRTIERIYSKLAKPTREQVEFIKNNPVPPGLAKIKNKDLKDDSKRFEKKGGDDRLVYDDRPNKEEKRAEKREEKFEKRQEKFEKRQEKFERREEKRDDRPKQDKFEKSEYKMSKQDNKGNGGGNMMKGGGNPNKGGGNPNKGGGGGNGGGKGNGGGGGGGKGGGKKN